MWLTIDPHLLLYAFLPALLFGDTMGLNIHVSSKSLPTCLLLAGPGVLFGTFATGVFAKLLFSDWSFCLCLTFGAIMAATDPVAVVALLKELGAPKTLGTLIEGESLMNDGSAVVLFVWVRNCIGYDYAMDSAWNKINKGKLWKDIKHKYEVKEEDAE